MRKDGKKTYDEWRKNKMFCQNCGTQLEEGASFCPKCGKAVSETAVQNEPAQGTKKKDKKPRKKKWLIPIVIIAAIMILVALFSSGGSSDEADKVSGLISDVQNGYLGHYDTVAIKDVFAYAYEDGQWNGGEAASGEYYIVEFASDDLVKIQFTVYEGEDTFKVSGFELPGVEETYEAYDIKLFLDAVYSAFAGTHQEYGLVIDESTENNTLEGHYGPVKSVEESEYALKAENEMELEEETIETAEETTEESNNSEVDEIRDYLADFGLAVYDEPDYFTDEVCQEYYEEIMATFAEYGLTIDEMKDILWNSEIATHTEDEVNAMSKWDILVEYEYLAYQSEGMYTDFEEESEGTTINSDNYVDWVRSAVEGETVSIYNLTVTSLLPSMNMIDVYITFSDGTRQDMWISSSDTNYLRGDIINVTGTYKGRNSGDGYPIIEATSITLN